MEHLKSLEKKLNKQLEDYAESGDISASSLNAIHVLTDTIKNIKKIEMLDESGDHGDKAYSRDGGWEARGGYGYPRYHSYDGGVSYDDGDSSYARNSYDGGSSHRGRHHVRGHYSRSDGYSMNGYSRAEASGKMIDRLEDMMSSAESDKERRAIEKAIQMIEGM